MCYGTPILKTNYKWHIFWAPFLVKWDFSISNTASTTASNLLWALALHLWIFSSSRSAHAFLRLLLRLSTLAWGYSQAFLAKIPHMAKSITLRSGEDGGQKHLGQNHPAVVSRKFSTILALMFLASILTWPQCYGLYPMGNFDKEGLWKPPC